MARNIRIEERGVECVEHNGITFIARRVLFTNDFTVSAFVEAGQMDDAIPGVKHFLEHIICKGGAISPLSNEDASSVFFNNIGGWSNAITSYVWTSYDARVPGNRWRDAIRKMGDLISNPFFSEDVVERERQVILAEYADFVTNAANDDYRHIARAVYKHIHEGRSLGTPETIKRITTKDLRQAYADYQAGRLIVAMEGRASPSAMIDEAIRCFDLPWSPEIAPPVHPKRFVPQTHFINRFSVQNAVACKLLLDGNHPYKGSPVSSVAVELFQHILCDMNGPLLQRLRQKEGGLYGCRPASVSLANDAFLLTLSLSTVPEKIRPMISGVVEHLGNLGSDISDAFFKRVQENCIRNLRNRNLYRRPIGARQLALSASVEGVIRPVATRLEALRQLTREDVGDVMGKMLASGLSVIYDGPRGDYPTHTELMAQLPWAQKEGPKPPLTKRDFLLARNALS